ncbi:FAD-dependent monooxygenase [Glutamicibacter protophormiae]|uniref:FAD-dependent monooxygenase n=1 Tax=Glutamicibacter protophormiae TaxID=37930 RepID=UPI00195E2DD0|nr:FAD-dependent monooxygenase [Glutamicibacter protophormiae]QRQ78072.1 FAD-dependent monooxygenase [Glutamicibacter protophormiae]
MQYYLNGFHTGDPDLFEAVREHNPQVIPAEVDVLIAGTGPAGAVLTAQLAQFPEITTLVVEKNDGPLLRGHADGVACRTVEMFESFGLADRLLREGYGINEITFWGPDAQDRNNIVRTGRNKDVAEGLSEYPHLIVNQARLQDFLFQKAAKSPTRTVPYYGVELLNVENTNTGGYPVTATLRSNGEDITVRAKYVVGTDGARSNVRRSMGVKLEGDARNHAWGVLDILAVTNFPDIRFKAAIQNADGGNILLIPREGGHMFRLYVDMGALDPEDREARNRFTPEQLIATAQHTLSPFTLDVKEIVWWSAYEVGQRLASRFDDLEPGAPSDRDPRIFIAGDACHTHSAKAGQGMNVSMQDTFNLGWKLTAVLQGRSPASLLRTYSAERQAIAKDLIDFDVRWSKTLSAKPKNPQNPEAGGLDKDEMQQAYLLANRYTAGFATVYTPSLLTGGTAHQQLASGFPVGERFYSSVVTRIADAQLIELGHTALADGRWRLYAFADAGNEKFDALMNYLAMDEASPVRRFTPAGRDVDAVFDIKGVYQRSHADTTVDKLPATLLPAKGKYGLHDYQKAYASALIGGGQEIFEARSIDRSTGALIVVRPDQYVAQVLPLDATGELAEFFAAFMQPQLVLA